MSIDLKQLNIDVIQEAFRSSKFTSEELTTAYLANIKKDDTNAFISVNKNALLEARAADKKIKAGQAGPLTGVPIAIKDIILVEGQLATGGSKILENYQASYTATAVARLKEAGMVILGKTNCDEFAMGSSNENSYFGPVRNPYDKSRVSGGSSGGSAAAVAANLAPLALGTDTGGSIRQPASFCGIVGLKPSYGRVSRYGSIAMTSSLDQIGPMTNTVKDAAYLLTQMAGFDKYDATSSQTKVLDYIKNIDKDVKKIRIGVPEEYFARGIDEEVKQAVEDKIAILKKQGFAIKSVKLPYTEYALAVYYLLMPAEVSSNLARYDGLLYGMGVDKNLSLDDWYKTVRSQGFGAESKRRIILGTYILSAGYYDAYYKQAQKLRTLIKNDFSTVFKEVDALITPVTPSTAFKIGEKSKDPLAMYLSDIFTVGANIAGICALSLPIAKDNHNMPIAMQILAKPFAEDILFKLGNYIEKTKK
ncbi:MAG: Asp-tRNA(Asn)/Glu-tRNA(Gln) amidotransferase subunit GatA [Patescibacteria group bacterium]|jgi:aspartyl-tRNA(Asn)/glutamyl-tRNA(Gln) amidotransferase subunit A